MRVCPHCREELLEEVGITAIEWGPIHKVHRECPKCAASWADVYEFINVAALETPEYTWDPVASIDITEYTTLAHIRCSFCRQEMEVPITDLPINYGGKKDPRWFTCPSCNLPATISPATT